MKASIQLLLYVGVILGRADAFWEAKQSDTRVAKFEVSPPGIALQGKGESLFFSDRHSKYMYLRSVEQLESQHCTDMLFCSGFLAQLEGAGSAETFLDR